MPLLTNLIREIDACPCVYCGQTLPDRIGLCQDCLREIPLIRAPLCPGCGAENDGIFDLCGKCLKEEKRVWSKAIAVMRMEGAGREIIHRFKYGKETAFARTLGHLAAEIWLEQGDRADLVVPTPLHWSRQLFRGYNQSELCADIFSVLTGLARKNILTRTKMTSKQANLNREQRKKNLLSAFSVKKQANCQNRTILLLDDVMTTGATLSSAASALLKAGAAEVKVLVLARA